MKRYLRPIGILAGSAARAAVEQGAALPLAGGPLAFSLVEIIERRRSGTRRHIAAAPSMRDALAHHIEARPAIGPLSAEQPIVMGIINATPDSFSDGGIFLDADKAIAHGRAMLEAGAGIIDIGGESTRPGAHAVSPAEEIARIRPVIAGLRASADAVGALISVDTRNAETMRAALDAGAKMINDVSALTHDSAALSLLAKIEAPTVLMHAPGDPETMQSRAHYEDAALDVFDYLEARVAACEGAGIGRQRLIADPGIGFGKTGNHNLQLLGQLSLFHGLGVNLMVGLSRKSFIGRLSTGEPPERRLPGSLAGAVMALGQGVRILRVHDVPETMQALKFAKAVSASG
ncbi:MAG TPA: dihydropteroate synthase [Alphaproteobacteria bacterium]|nr:dihydropteroate synthase [Alphaproteobacteria bacterium]